MGNYPLAAPRPRTVAEALAFNYWMKENKVNDYDPYGIVRTPDYDYFGAYQAGQGRMGGGHFTDRFKLPYHETFSNESQYYKPGMTAVRWVKDKPAPIL